METIKNNISHLVYAGIIIFLLFFFKCGGGREIVTIPGKSGEIKTETKIQYLPSKPQVITLKGKDGKTITIETENPVNKDLLDAFNKASDSIKKLKLYAKAIEENEQIRTFEKDGVKVDVKSKVRGELLIQSIEYKTAPQKIEVPKDNFSFLLSGGATKNIITQQMTLQAGAGIRIKEVSVLATIDTHSNLGVTLIKQF